MINNVKANKSPKRLPLPEKREAAKAMKKQGYTYSDIAEWLGIGLSTAKRYMNIETPEDLADFETEFNKVIKLMKYEGIGQVHKKLNELVPKEKKIDQVVKAGEFFEGKTQHQTNLQVNMGVEFIQDGDTS